MAYQGVDLNNLNAYDLVPNMPAVRPRYYPEVPTRADTFEVYHAVASQMGVTTLDSYYAPDATIAPGLGLGNSYAIPGNGIVLTGNAPTSGIYTGIQQE